MNHWYAVGELTRQHHADLDSEAARDGLARTVRSGGAGHPTWLARFGGAIRGLVRRDPSLTDLPCRLPDGRLGRIGVVEQQGEWVLVCRVA